MTTITTRAVKGSPLSWNEMDANFNNLNNFKQELLPSQTGNTGKVLGTDGSNLSWVAGGSGGGGSGGVIAAADIFNGGASFYNLSVTPLSINNIIVVVDGIVLTPGMDYSLSGSIVTPISIWTTGTNNVNIWTIAASTNAVSTWGSITGTLSNQTDLNTALGLKANTSSLATVATSGSYNDLSSKPTIPAQFNPIAGTNVTLSGTYPNITFNASGSGGSMTYPSGTGIAVVTSGTSWGTTLTAPTGAIVGTTDSQALTNKTYNGNTWTAGTGTLTIAAGKTLTNNNTITLVGTDSTTITFQGTDTYVGRTTTDTLTNKRVTARVGSTTSSATPTINTDLYDVYKLTAQAVDITSFTTNLTGTPADGDILIIEITGTAARAITWGASFEASTVALPTTTVSTNMLAVAFMWNAVTSKWRCMGAV